MKKVKLGDLVTVMNEREDNPSQSKYDRFVGLEHYDSGSVSITRWGSTEMLVSAMKVFHRGDILVARRNVYLKRASSVDFDGITSGDSIILHVNDEQYKDIVPFVLNTDSFWDYADQHSDGSMSKRLAPKTMLEYEFTLPDDGEVERLSTLLWSMERTKTAYKNLIAKTEELVKSQFVEMFGDPIDNPMGWFTKSLTSMGTCKNGMNFHNSDSGVEISCLGVGDFKDYSVIDGTSSLPTVSLNEMPPEDYLLRDEDIVFVRSNGNKTMVGRSVVVYPGDTLTTFSGFCIRYRNEDKSIAVPYLLRVLKTDSMRKQMYGRGANIQNLNQQILASLQIPVPPMQLQEQYIAFVAQADKSKFAAQQALADLTATQKALMRQYLG